MHVNEVIPLPCTSDKNHQQGPLQVLNIVQREGRLLPYAWSGYLTPSCRVQHEF